jgi:hypothetical protein
MSGNEAAGENGVLKDFDVTITETLEKTVTVKAADQLDAEQIVNDEWDNSEHILDAGHFTGVRFEAKPTGRDLMRDVQPHEKGGNHDMDENATAHGESLPLAENEYVKELFSILQDNGKDSTGLAALLGHVSEMENFVKRAEDKIVEMKSQLAEMKEVQNHPVRTALQSAIKNLENKVAEIKEHLSTLKHSIVESCKNAVTAFKEKGISALNNLASFFKVKTGLDNLKKSIDGAIKADDKAIAKISTFANEYHSAGRAIKNMARVAVGKQPIDAKKEAGKLAKAFAAPYKAQKAALTGLKKTIDKAVTSLENLEISAKEKQAQRPAAKKPSLLEQLQDTLAVVEQAKREHRAQERVTAKGTEL